MPSTTVTEPKKQAPMQMDSSSVVASQPISEPRPEAEMQPQMTLRGGGFFCGFSCCDGQCRCGKNCC